MQPIALRLGEVDELDAHPALAVVDRAFAEGVHPDHLALQLEQVVRARAVALPLSTPLELCDTCGTGGDGRSTINISTLAALVAASAGARIVKHGNRAASGRCGSADLLEALGVNLMATPEQTARCVEEIGFGFCFAPRFHPAMQRLAPIRKRLAMRTLFNLLGPLTNPAPLTFQLLGVAEHRLMPIMVEAMQRLGIRHGMVVHGADGLDEATTTGESEVLELREGTIRSWRLDPRALGLPHAHVEALTGSDATRNAVEARRLLGGQRSPQRDVVALNAACVLYVADRAASLAEGLRRALYTLETGASLTVLDRIKDATHAR